MKNCRPDMYKNLPFSEWIEKVTDNRSAFPRMVSAPVVHSPLQILIVEFKCDRQYLIER